MMKLTLTFIVELIVVFVGIALFILFTSSLIQTFFEEPSSIGYLGVWPLDNCRGSLSLSSSGSGNCMIKAQILTSNCLDKKYQIKEESCFGNLRCEDTVSNDYHQATCSWFSPIEKQKYVLCVGGIERDSAYATCK